MARVKPDETARVADNSCPLCARDRGYVVDLGPGGRPVSCVTYHPGFDTPGLRRYTPKGECWLVGADGIRRREPDRDFERHSA